MAKVQMNLSLSSAFLVGDDPRLVELHHRVDHHLGVHAEVLLVLERQRRGVGDAPDAQLDGGLVGDQLGDVVADGQVGGVGLGRGERRDLVVVLDEPVDVRDVQVGVAERARQVLVDLQEDEVGVLQDVLLVGDAQRERDEALGVHRGAGDEDVGLLDVRGPGRRGAACSARR
jgi:hypothetical protein